MNFENEFSTVNLILNSQHNTRGIDAFILSHIKIEKQIRRIFTFLIYQHPVFTNKDIPQLRETLASNTKMYFENFIIGINQIYQKSIEEMYGDHYTEDLIEIRKIIRIRNKIYHGQITSSGLSRSSLIEKINFLKKWGIKFEEIFDNEIGYSGFSNSFKKSDKQLNLINLDKFSNIENYKIFLSEINR
ncbi:hypothetical protein [Myroides sp. TSA_177.3]|uniref:hypothetical protein n=1 Tax=Myroides sp. TSA_177.3 TaxID=3415650 RepID=UPI00404602FA